MEYIKRENIVKSKYLLAYYYDAKIYLDKFFNKKNIKFNNILLCLI